MVRQTDADKRHRANQVREDTGRQIIPWTFVLPRNTDNAAQGPEPSHGEDKQRKKRRKRTPQYGKETASTPGQPPNPLGRRMEPKITWAEFLQGHALPHSKLRFDPLNNQRTVKWTSTDIPARRATDGSFPQMRSNIMELVRRYQQEAWWGRTAYTLSRF